MEKWIARAKELGFDQVQPIDVSTLEFMSNIRSMCALNLCGRYGKCWTCPPVCGNPEVCRRRLTEFNRGFLVQTRFAHTAGSIANQRKDYEDRHRNRFTALCEALYPEHPEALCLISGGCRVCETCAWPETCPYPEKAASCLTAYGLLTARILRDNGLEREDDDSIGFTGFVLLP